MSLEQELNLMAQREISAIAESLSRAIERGLRDENMRAATTVIARDGDSVTVTVATPDGVPYPTWQNTGTGIYGPLKRVITPRRARVMTWVGPNGRVFAKSVRGVSKSKGWWDRTITGWAARHGYNIGL